MQSKHNFSDKCLPDFEYHTNMKADSNIHPTSSPLKNIFVQHVKYYTYKNIFQ